MFKLNTMTYSVSRWARVLGLLALASAGCSDLDADVGTGGTSGTGGNGGTVPETLTVYYEFYERNPGSEEPRLEGVRVCGTYADETQSCATSNASGRAVIEYRTNEEFTHTVEKEGYGSFIAGVIIGATPYGVGWPLSYTMVYFDLVPDSDLEALAAQLETSYPWQGGSVVLAVTETGTLTSLEGVSFVPVGSTVDEVGDAFYYDAATEQYSLGLEATSAPVLYPWDLPLGGQGGFTEVTPGVQEFEIIGAGDCHGPVFGWAGDAPNRIRVPVRDGFKTFGRVECDAP